MHIAPTELKDKTLWHKRIKEITEVDDVYGTASTSSASITCVQETSGYAVWYSRHLNDDPMKAEAKNGEYLLGFYGSEHRDKALEYAVVVANSGTGEGEIISVLDNLAKHSLSKKE